MSQVFKKQKVAQSYATALSDELASLADFDLVIYQIRHLTPLLTQEDILKIWLSPSLTSSQKTALLNEIMNEVKRHFDGHQEIVHRFISVVLSSGRICYLPLISAELSKIAEKRKNIKLARLTVASPLNKAALEQIKTAAETLFRSKLRWQIITDPSLIAGFKITVGHSSFDGSIKSRVDALMLHLAGQTSFTN